jgi:hypothetical protein
MLRGMTPVGSVSANYSPVELELSVLALRQLVTSPLPRLPEGLRGSEGGWEGLGTRGRRVGGWRTGGFFGGIVADSNL